MLRQLFRTVLFLRHLARTATYEEDPIKKATSEDINAMEHRLSRDSSYVASAEVPRDYKPNPAQIPDHSSGLLMILSTARHTTCERGRTCQQVHARLAAQDCTAHGQVFVNSSYHREGIVFACTSTLYVFTSLARHRVPRQAWQHQRLDQV